MPTRSTSLTSAARNDERPLTPASPNEIRLRQINQAELDAFVRQIVREGLQKGDDGLDQPGPSTLPNESTNPVT